MENELLRTRTERPGPLARTRSRPPAGPTAWSACARRGTCLAPRSTPADETLKPAPARRGPKPAIADADLLAAIRADLAASPFQGEGHRKVWARLRIQK